MYYTHPDSMSITSSINRALNYLIDLHITSPIQTSATQHVDLLCLLLKLADLSRFITQAAAEKVIGIKLIASSFIFTCYYSCQIGVGRQASCIVSHYHDN